MTIAELCPAFWARLVEMGVTPQAAADLLQAPVSETTFRMRLATAGRGGRDEVQDEVARQLRSSWRQGTGMMGRGHRR
jgi:hypothetical protein